jgi:hypothetical protein
MCNNSCQQTKSDPDGSRESSAIAARSRAKQASKQTGGSRNGHRIASTLIHYPIKLNSRHLCNYLLLAVAPDSARPDPKLVCFHELLHSCCRPTADHGQQTARTDSGIDTDCILFHSLPPSVSPHCLPYSTLCLLNDIPIRPVGS